MLQPCKHSSTHCQHQALCDLHVPAMYHMHCINETAKPNSEGGGCALSVVLE